MFGLTQHRENSYSDHGPAAALAEPIDRHPTESPEGIGSDGMAAFSDADTGRLDYQLLRDGPISSYFDRRILAEDLVWLRQQGYAVDILDAGSWSSAEVALDALAATLEFPEYFGRNLDALNDCLSELPIPDESGRVVVLEGFDQLYASKPEWSWNLLDVFAGQSRSHLLFGKRLIVLLRCGDPRLFVQPVGACPVG
ncbi:MAG TPA: barstar family protein, partial [Myxococcaceae bacterium]|nr:barstar family protein [Myxococcaceae bacterium]